MLALCAAAAVIPGHLRPAGRRTPRSSFYAIAACATAAMLVFQTTLNVLGSVDLLPLTGVTFPFVSMGGSSMLSCWGRWPICRRHAAARIRQRRPPRLRLPPSPPQATGFLDELGVATDDIFGKEDAR